jgi:hypothetical protein
MLDSTCVKLSASKFLNFFYFLGDKIVDKIATFVIVDRNSQTGARTRAGTSTGTGESTCNALACARCHSKPIHACPHTTW